MFSVRVLVYGVKMDELRDQPVVVGRGAGEVPDQVAAQVVVLLSSTNPRPGATKLGDIPKAFVASHSPATGSPSSGCR